MLLLQNVKIFGRTDPLRSLAGRIGDIHIGRRSPIVFQELAVKIIGGYAPQETENKDVRNAYHDALSKSLHSPRRTTKVLCTDGNRVCIPNALLPHAPPAFIDIRAGHALKGAAKPGMWDHAPVSAILPICPHSHPGAHLRRRKYGTMTTSSKQSLISPSGNLS